MRALAAQIGAWTQGGLFRLPLAEANLLDKSVLLPLMDAAAVLEMGDLAPATTAADGAITLSGRGRSHPFQGAQVTLVFRSAGDAIAMTLDATFAGLWQFSHSFPALAGTYVDRFPFASAHFSFPGNAPGQDAGLWFEGPLSAPGERLQFLALFAEFLPVMAGRIVALDGRFDFQLRHAAQLPMDLQRIDHNAFTLGLACHSEPRRPAANGGRPIFLRGKQITRDGPGLTAPFHSGYFFLETTLAPTINGTVVHIPLEARAHNPAQDITAIAYLDEASKFSLHALGEFIGQNIPLPGFLNNLHLEEYVALHAIELRLSPWLPSKLSRLALHVMTTKAIALPFPSADQSLFGIEDIGLTIAFVNPLSQDNFDWLLHLQGSIRVGAQGLLRLATNFTQAEPAPVITGELAEGHPLKIGELIRHLTSFDGSSLPELEIEQLQFYIDTNTWQWEFQIQMHDVWRIASGDKELRLQQLGAHIARLPEEGLVVDVAAVLEFGGLRIELIAEHPGASEAGWRFEGELIDDEPLNLNFILAHLENLTFFTLPPHLPDVFIHEIGVTYHTGTRDFSFAARTEIDAPVGDLGAHLFVEAQIAVAATHDDQEKTHIDVQLAAKLQVAGHAIDVRSSLHAEEQVLYAQWSHDTDGIHLASLLHLLDDSHTEDATRKHGLDLTVRKLAFEYAHSEQAHDFLFTAQTREGWDLYVVGQRRLAGWRFLLNLEFASLADAQNTLPEGIRTLLAGDHGFRLGRLSMAVATGSFEDFRFPSLPTLPGADQPQPLEGATTPDFDAGLYLHIAVDLASADHPASTILPPHLVFTAGIDLEKKEILLEAALDGTFALPGKDKDKLHLDKVVFSLALPDVALRLRGGANLCIGSTELRLRADFKLDRKALQADLDVEFQKGGVQFMGVEGLYLDRLGGLLGITFPPTPGLEIGLFGAMHFGDEGEGADAVGIILLFEGEVPLPKLLELRIAHLDVAKLIERFLPKDSPHSSQSLAPAFELRDFYLLWALDDTSLPDGREIPAGFSFSAILHVLGLQAYAALSANAATGITGIAVCNAFDIGGLLHVSGGSAGYTRVEVRNERGEWEQASLTTVNVGSDVPQRDTRRQEIVPPGGPEIIFHSQGDDLLHLDLEISIFHFLKERVAATISGSKIAFQLAYEAGNVAGMNLSFTFEKGQGFEAAAECHFRLGGELDIHVGDLHLGKLNLTLAANAEIALGYIVAEQRFWLNIDFEANLFGWQIGPLQVRLTTKLTDLAELAGHMVQAVVAHLSSSLSDLWEYLFHRERFLAAQRQAQAEAARKARAQSNQAYLEAFQAHQADLQGQAQRDFEAAMQAVSVILGRAQDQYALAVEQAAAYTALGDEKQQVVQDRLAEITLEDPHQSTRLAEIQTWTGDTQQRRSLKAKRALPNERVAAIYQRARAGADDIHFQAQRFAQEIAPTHG